MAEYDFDIIVIGGGPAGYAAAIRAAQLKRRVLCVERENLGGICLNWGCIPTKALLDDAAFIRKLRTEAPTYGITLENLHVDFARIIGRSRGVAEKLKNGITYLFRKYGVKHEAATGQVLGPHRVKITGSDGTHEATADHVILATGARPTALSGVPFDGQKVIGYREALTLPERPERIAIIGGGAIGCEFADFYNAVGTEVTLVEALPHLLPSEDEEVSGLLERVFAKRGIKVHTGTRTDSVETTGSGVRLTLSGHKPGMIEADCVLVAIGVTGNAGDIASAEAGLELFRDRVKVDPQYRTNLENVWAIGDVISIHWPEQVAMGGHRHPDLAHVAHHEAVYCVERICGIAEHDIDYRKVPGCTYTHPQVASLGSTEKRLREEGRELRVGQFPFRASGRAMAAGEVEGFVKLIFDAGNGELLGVHMVGENVSELLSELVLAQKLGATEAQILDVMHPHPTLSEAVMEAAGVAAEKSIHF